MRELRSSDGTRGRRKAWRYLTIACLLAAVVGVLLPQPHAQQPQPGILPASIAPIYASSPNDSWNRIFYYLFSRQFKSHLSSDFPEAAPLVESSPDSVLRISSALFERTETGDRAIEPLYFPYPSTAAGRRQLVVEPIYSGLVAALQDALSETQPRSALARSLMQRDLWAACDILREPIFPEDRTAELDRRHQMLFDLLGRLIAKLALTRAEINSLPDNYAAAMARYSLPDLFGKDSGWIEIRWFPDHMHDSVAGYRQFTRVFIKPAHPPRDKQQFLNSLRDPDHDTPAALDGVALVIQSILIDARGRLTPTRLTTDVQLRLFKKSNLGAFMQTELRVCELSRKLMLTEPQSGGLASEDESSLTYFGGYGFATASHPGGPSGEPGPPLLVKLKTRCFFCHGENATRLMTFMIARPPHFKPPNVEELDGASLQAADFSLTQKEKGQNFKSLRAYF